MDTSTFDLMGILEQGSKYSGAIIGLIAAATTPLFNRFKVLSKYQFGIPSIFNLFGFLFVIPVYLFVWINQPTTYMYYSFPYIAALGVVVILISFLNGFFFKGACIGQCLKVFMTGFSILTYAIGVSMIVFSINAYSLLNSYYLFVGEVVSETDANKVNQSVSLYLGGSHTGKFTTKTNHRGEYVFFLTRSQICYLNKIELFVSKKKSKEMRYIDIWPGLDPSCVNDVDSAISKPARRYQFQEELEI